MDIPVLMVDEVYHWGTLAVSQKGSRFSDSFEGHCLSVSRCPLAWLRIAKLGGSPLWRLTRRGGVFLDILSVGRNPELRQIIQDWGIARGYAENRTLWQAWSSDEDGEWRYMLFASEDEARVEVVEDDEGPDGGDAVVPVEVLTGTALLCARLGRARMEGQDAFDFVAMVWAEDGHPALDGVWWGEVFDPDALSAPRGGIFPGKVGSWTSAESATYPGMDDEDSEGIIEKVIPA